MMKPLLAEAERDQVPFLHSYDLKFEEAWGKVLAFLPRHRKEVGGR